MYRSLIATVALISLAGCQESAQQPANNTGANAAAPTAQAGVLGAPVGGERAKTLMHERHEGMEDIGDAFKAAARWTKSDNPNVADVREYSAVIARLAPLVSSWYPPGTGPEAGKTRAKAEIWQKPDDFAAKMKALQAEAPKFDAAAQGNDAAAAIAAHAELGKTCKACHDLYRAPEGEHGHD